MGFRNKEIFFSNIYFLLFVDEGGRIRNEGCESVIRKSEARTHEYWTLMAFIDTSFFDKAI